MGDGLSGLGDSPLSTPRPSSWAVDFRAFGPPSASRTAADHPRVAGQPSPRLRLGKPASLTMTKAAAISRWLTVNAPQSPVVGRGLAIAFDQVGVFSRES